jgi:hypothetical protein
MISTIHHYILMISYYLILCLVARNAPLGGYGMLGGVDCNHLNMIDDKKKGT